MTHKVTTLRIAVSAVLAAATIISIGAVCYKPAYQAEADHTAASNSSRSAQLSDPSGRLLRVHLSLRNW
jgi:hypothetical protein